MVKEDLRDHLNDIYTSQKTTAISLKNDGNTYYKQGFYQEALDCYNRALQIEPNNRDILHNKGLTLVKLNMVDEYLGEALNNLENIEGCLAIIGIKVSKKVLTSNTEGGSDKIETLCRDAYEPVTESDNLMSINRAKIVSWIKVGNSRHAQKRYRNAVTCYDTALQIDPNNLDALIRKKQAITEYEKSTGKKYIPYPQPELHVESSTSLMVSSATESPQESMIDEEPLESINTDSPSERVKRDLDLIRDLLFSANKVESLIIGDGVSSELGLEKYTNDLVSKHIWLLSDARLLRMETVTTRPPGWPRWASSPRTHYLKGLTWQGHDFLDMCKDEEIWVKTKKVFAEMGGFTLDELNTVLVNLRYDKMEKILKSHPEEFD